MVTQDIPGGTAAPDLWAGLCTGFHDLRLRAYAVGLEQRWRDLARADPRGADLLSRWLDLAEEVGELDKGERVWAVRYGEDEADTDDWWDDWDQSGDRFVCPEQRCSRVAVQFLQPPECWLFGRQMTPGAD